jgi:hypothetical protein
MTALYVPPTDEADHKKQNQSLQLIGGITSTNTTNIASNTASIATNTTNIATNTTNIAANTAAIAAIPAASPITNTLSGDVTLNNTANFFDGPSVAQGSTGTWFASGTVTLQDTAGAARFNAKLWDGTTVIASASATTGGATLISISLSGFLAAPAGNLRISCRDVTATTGKIIFNNSGSSKDSTITAYRIA